MLSAIDILLWCAAIIAIVVTLAVSTLVLTGVFVAVIKQFNRRSPANKSTPIFSSMVNEQMIKKYEKEFYE